MGISFFFFDYLSDLVLHFYKVRELKRDTEVKIEAAEAKISLLLVPSRSQYLKNAGSYISHNAIQ